jgi:diguanylate cyclase (GGDEF)-like protein
MAGGAALMNADNASTMPGSDIVDMLPLGVFLLDEAGCIRGWNTWLADQTGITRQEALGKPLQKLFPGFEKPRFAGALQEVFANGSPQILSQALNQYLIPIKVRISGPHAVPLMQQKVQLSLLVEDSGERLALISIVDVTENVILSQVLGDAERSLKESNNRDALTGLYNRRFMSDWLDLRLKESRRIKYPIACLVLDIDHFRMINDIFGHPLGDLVLKDFSILIAGKLRDCDVLVRYGGDEFVVLLVKCTLNGGVARAQELIEFVRCSSIGTFPAGGVTCSAGVSVFDPGEPCSDEEMVSQAEAQLHQAKRNGRDCVFPVPEPSLFSIAPSIAE